MFRNSFAPALLSLALAASPSPGGPPPTRIAFEDGGGGLNLIVREIRVSPIRVRAGEPVRIELVVENRMEGAGTVRARVTANGREIDRRLYSYGTGGEGGRLTVESFTWDTSGERPGSYRIRGEVYEPRDTSPSDNEMEPPDPVVVLAPGSAEKTGGESKARDPRYDPRRSDSPKGG
jgi:hypothetical protein